MTTRPKRKRESPGPAGAGTGETIVPPEERAASAEAPVDPAPAETSEAVMPAAATAGTEASVTEIEPAEPEAATAEAPEAPVNALEALAPAIGRDESLSAEELRQDEAVVDRVEHLAKDVGWVLVAAGVIGIVMPGVLGTPFLIAGAAALWPGNRTRFQRWREGQSPRFLHGSMKQIDRFLDDLERRYPKNGKR